MKTTNILSREEFDIKFFYSSSTRMMQQYLDIKFEHQDCFLLFRMGDFYELFFDDARDVSKILNIVLSKRGKVGENDVPMCGVPFHALENYLSKLLEKGVKVAICEQLESPEESKKRDGYKAVVKRDVIRIITPGTVIEDAILNSVKPNYLAALFCDKDQICMSYGDISTGEVEILDLKKSELHSELFRVAPKEIVISEKTFADSFLKSILRQFENLLVFQPDHQFELKRCERHIENFYNIKSAKSIGFEKNIQISSMGALLQYIITTQKSFLPKLKNPSFLTTSDFMSLDYTTRKSLELTETIYGKKQGSLLSVLDSTLTSSGSRLLHNMILSPLNNKERIEARQKITRFFFENEKITYAIREILKDIRDIDRCLAKILMRRSSPFDILALKYSLISVCKLKDILFENFGIENLDQTIKNFHASLAFEYNLIDTIEESIKEDASNNISDGGFIKESYHSQLEALGMLIRNSRSLIDELKLKYQKLTGIDNLKINNNNIVGLYIEVPSRFAEKMDPGVFKYKQSTSTTVRYGSQELEELESRIVNANSLYLALEQEIYEKICAIIGDHASSIRRVAEGVAQIDVFSSLAFFAGENSYVLPIIDESNDTLISKGRHPVVEYYLKKEQANFVPNNLSFQKECGMIILTGPNMGGKSTFLRQIALITILAQIGSYVPAESCRIGLVDRIFSRVGSGDDLSSGKSTFMVEMQETSSILSRATKNSLIIFDEVGRGTSTYDGMAIAWAIIEYVYEKIGARTLFATHYHELTKLSLTFPRLANFHVGIEEKNNEIELTHKVIKGAADKSYGIHVAEIAGLPKEVTRRASKILKEFEKNENKLSKMNSAIFTEDIFAKVSKEDLNQDKESSPMSALKSDVEEQIRNLKLEETSPFEALQILFDLQKKC